MDFKTIVDKYLIYRRKKRTSGREDNVLPLLPFLIMDAQYQIYCSDIAPIPCTQAKKQVKKKWIKAYNDFNKDFFRCFNQEETDFLIEQMDRFEEYISHHIKVAKVAILNFLQEEGDLEDRKVLAACMMCNVLAQSAQIIYRRMYRDAFMNPEENADLRAVANSAYQFSLFYPTKTRNLNLTESADIMKSVDVLCKKIINWIREER